MPRDRSRVVQPAHQRPGRDPHQIRRRWQSDAKVRYFHFEYYSFTFNCSTFFYHIRRIHDTFAHVQLSDIRVIATLGVGGFGRVELVQIGNDATRSYGLKQMKKSQVILFVLGACFNLSFPPLPLYIIDQAMLCKNVTFLEI